MKTSRLLSAMAIMAILIYACKGDTGPVGPSGTDGSNGINGSNGVANISTTIYLVAPNDWTGGSGIYTATATDDSIKNSNTDEVSVFTSISNNGTWAAIPVSNYLITGDQLLYSYHNNTVVFIYQYSSAPASNIYMKVVTIPPAARRLHPNTNWNDYSQVNGIVQAQKTNQ